MANVPPQKPSLDVFGPLSPGPLSPRGESYTNHDWSRRPSASRHQRRESIASTTSSVGGSLDMSMHSRLGAVTNTGRNAISTLLQPPIVRTGLIPHTSAPASATHRPPSTRDIPPVTLTNIPHVEATAFQPYLAQVGSLYEARARTEAEEPSPQWNRKDLGSVKEGDASGFFNQGQRGDQQSRPPSRGSISAMSPIESPPVVRRRSSGGILRRAQLAVTPLSTIPGVYFDESFHLENPRTFDVVTERSEVIRNPQNKSEEIKEANGSANGASVAPRKALATNAILQEKLSWYLDTVEIHLISSISAASKSFFAALGSLKELHSEAADSVEKIQKLREDLAQLDKEMAIGRLEIVRMKQRRDNLRKLSDATQQLQNAMKGAAHCEELVDRGELETSLDRIGVIEDYTCGHYNPENLGHHLWLCSEPPGHLLDLRQLKALEGFGSGMNQLRSRIGTGFQSRFMEVLLTDLREHITTVPNPDTLKRWASASMRGRIQLNASSSPPAYLKTNNQLRMSLSATLVGLKRSRYTIAATAAFRDAVNKEMKSLIRQNLPSSSDDDNESVASVSVSTMSSRAPLSQQEKSAILARNLRALDPEDAEELFKKTYCAVGEALRRLQVQCKVLLDVSSDDSMSPTTSPVGRQSMASLDAAIRQIPPARSPSPNLQEELTQALDLSSLLGQAVDVAQSQIIKVLKVRSEQTTQLPLPLFLRYFTLNRLFADECEAVSGRSGAALKGVINTQITEFIGKMVDSERMNLSGVMEADKWDVRDFDNADTAVLAKIMAGMTSDPPSYLQQAFVWEDAVLNGTAPVESTTNGTTTKEKTRSALVDEEKFLLTDSAAVFIRGVSNFQTLIACIPNISSEVSTALVDYLKLFNSLSCQLILGAGAMRSSAGLKNINTKHLALASQALSFVIILIPYMREFVRRRPGMSGGSTTADYDKVKRLYHDHQVGIHEKLAEIMSARATAHIKAMSKVNWDADSSGESASPHMETLTKQTSILQRVLSKHLDEPTIKSIMVSVFASYREQWGKAFREATPKTEAGKTRLLRDAELFKSRLSKLDGAGEVGTLLINIVQEKKVAELPSKKAAEVPEVKTDDEEKKTDIKIQPDVKNEEGLPAINKPQEEVAKEETVQ